MKIFLFLFSCLLLFGCIHELDYLKSDVEQVPVVNCLFQADSIFEVYVGLTTEIFTEQSRIIPDAKVYIIENQTDTIRLNKVTDNLFKSSEVAVKGVEYKLVVESYQYGVIWATDKIPDNNCEIDTIIPDFYCCVSEDGISFTSKYHIKLINIPTYNSYFELTILDREKIMDSIYRIYGADSNFYDHIWDNESKPPLYQNTEIENNTIEYIFAPERRISSREGFHFEFYYDNVYSYVFILKSTSYDYYLYKKSLWEHKKEEFSLMSFEDFSNMLFVKKEIKIHSNINNGIGIFAGFSVADYRIIDTIPTYIEWPNF